MARFGSESRTEVVVKDREITEGVCPGGGSSRGDEIDESGGVESPGEVP